MLLFLLNEHLNMFVNDYFDHDIIFFITFSAIFYLALAISAMFFNLINDSFLSK
jgi:hypothetical protein